MAMSRCAFLIETSRWVLSCCELVLRFWKALYSLWQSLNLVNYRHHSTVNRARLLGCGFGSWWAF